MPTDLAKPVSAEEYRSVQISYIKGMIEKFLELADHCMNNILDFKLKRLDMEEKIDEINVTGIVNRLRSWSLKRGARKDGEQTIGRLADILKRFFANFLYDLDLLEPLSTTRKRLLEAFEAGLASQPKYGRFEEV